MQTVYKALIRSTNGRLTTTPRRGKIIVTAESISNEWETVALSAITDIKMEKLFGFPFCIQNILALLERGAVTEGD